MKFYEPFREANLNRKGDQLLITILALELGSKAGSYVAPEEYVPILRKQGIRLADIPIVLKRISPKLEEKGIYLWLEQ